jgi:hypothetical protein
MTHPLLSQVANLAEYLAPWGKRVIITLHLRGILMHVVMPCGNGMCKLVKKTWGNNLQLFGKVSMRWQ